jgi:hypothetical protein
MIITSISMCGPGERHSWVLNQLFLSRTAKENNPEEACKALHGEVQQPEPTESVSDGCRIILRQAGPKGTGTVTSTPTNLPTATPTRRPIIPVHEPKPALSNGAKAGIITAVVLCVLTSIALGIYIFSRRKRNTNPPINNNNDAKSPMDEISPVSDMLDGTDKFEADSKPVFRAELSGNTTPPLVELSHEYEIRELSAVKEYDDEKRRHFT